MQRFIGGTNQNGRLIKENNSIERILSLKNILK